MRYPQDRKKQSRQKVVAAAVEAFNENGIHGSGIAEIMERAGLTPGAFSRHFSSKDELLCEAIDAGFSQAPFIPPEHQAQSLEFLIGLYLSKGHRDNPTHACLAGTLTAEIARHPRQTRERFIAHLQSTFAAIDSKLSSRKKGAPRQRRVMAVFALMMGSLNLARLTKDTELSEAFLKAGIEAAEELISK